MVVEEATGPVVLHAVVSQALPERQLEHLADVLPSPYFFPISWRGRGPHGHGRGHNIRAHEAERLWNSSSSSHGPLTHAVAFWAHSWAKQGTSG